MTDDKKKKNYPDAERGYLKWWGTKVLSWFPPPHQSFESFGVRIRVNPELGLVHEGERQVIKLYFKQDDISKPRISLVLSIMERVLGKDNGNVYCLLDVRKSKLTRQATPGREIDWQAVLAEMQYIAALWPNL